MIKLAVSVICKAFDADAVIGTKVREGAHRRVLDAVVDAIGDHVPDERETPGQHFLTLPSNLVAHVTCGTGVVPPKDVDPTPFIVREWRGASEEFLRREYACETTGVAAVVYTREAYLADDDPDLMDVERDRIRQFDCTHVLVALLAFGGPPPRHTLPSGKTLGLTSPARLEANIAGANGDFEDLTEEELSEIREVNAERWNTYRTVAD